MTINLADFGLDHLSRDQQIELAHALWGSISSSHEPVPLSTGVRAELDRRIDDYERNPEDILTLEEVKANLAKKYGK